MVCGLDDFLSTSNVELSQEWSCTQLFEELPESRLLIVMRPIHAIRRLRTPPLYLPTADHQVILLRRLGLNLLGNRPVKLNFDNGFCIKSR